MQKILLIGAIESLGLHNNEGSINVSVEGQNRTYHGVGGLIGLPELKYSNELAIQQQTLSVSTIDPATEALLRGYNTRFAPCQIHLMLLDPTTRNNVGTVKTFDGFVDSVVIDGDSRAAELTLVSVARNGTIALTHTRSDATQKLIDATDEGFKYADSSKTQKVYWGSETKISPNHTVRKKP